jgi:hypothetical protein
MDWANDQLSRLVHAADRHLFAYGFTCPNCGEPVRLRAGVQRRPHFAHYSHSPKPDCEEYHPSVYPAPIFKPTAPARQAARSFQSVSLQGGIFLGREDSGRFSLHLRLPRLKDASGVEGELRIQSALGVRTFSATHLLRPQFMRVSPQVPLVDVSGTGDMEEAAAAIEQDISVFRASGNFFVGTESARLLAAEEPLEWSEIYRLLTRRPLPPAPAEIGCELLASAGTRDWFLYELRLPALQQEANGRIGAIVSHFTGRAVRVPIPRVYIVDPMPHHVDPDGTYVYSSVPTRLLLRRTVAVPLEIVGSAQSEAIHSVDFGEWTEVRGLGRGEAIIRHSGQTVASVRLEDCPLFDPQGVEIFIGSTWKLFDARVRAELEKPSSTVTIQSPTTRIADAIALDRTQWRQRGTHHVLVDGIEKPKIDAGNFGRVTWEAPPSPPDLITVEEPAIAVDSDVKLWIEGLVGRVAGWPGIAEVRQLWHHGQYERALVLSTHPWLKPYIAAALAPTKPGK